MLVAFLLLLLLLLLLYVLIGIFLDGTSIIVMTLPIALPLFLAARSDPIWFGIFIVIAVGIAQISPGWGLTDSVAQKS